MVDIRPNEEKGDFDLTPHGPLAGPLASFSVSNKSDCLRYAVNTQMEWCQHWVAERLTHRRKIGVLTHHTDGFSFDTYTPVVQPHTFHNLITGSANFISPFIHKTGQTSLSLLPRQADSYSDICCPLLLQAIGEIELKSFFNRCAVLLEPGGNLVLCFSVYYPCDETTKRTLRSAGFFEKRNKRVLNRIGFGQLEVLDEALPEMVWELNRNALHRCNWLWNAIGANSEFLSQHCRSGLSQNYPPEEIGDFRVSDQTYMTAVGLWVTKTSS